MIFYFSGTGNSKWIAEEIAKNTDDEIVNIMKLKNSQGSDGYTAEPGETIGLVFPVYAWGPPKVVSEFAKEIKFKKENDEKNDKGYTFAVCTCGAEAGNTIKKLSKDFPVDGAWSVTMPTNYIASPLDSEDVVEQKIKAAKEKLPKIISAVKEKKKIANVNKGSGAIFKSAFGYSGFNKFARGTGVFSVDDDCDSCGKCATVCQINMIELRDGKPNWKYAKCLQCMACINVCPKEAILYAGKKTKGTGRYWFEKDGRKYI